MLLKGGFIAAEGALAEVEPGGRGVRLGAVDVQPGTCAALPVQHVVRTQPVGLGSAVVFADNWGHRDLEGSTWGRERRKSEKDRVLRA